MIYLLPKKTTLLLFLLSPTLYALSPPLPPTNSFEAYERKSASDFSAANAASIHFLSIVDNKVYVGSWLEAGALLQDVITRDQWVGAMKATRAPLGYVTARSVASHTPHQGLPGGVRGDFMTIKYDTQFSNKLSAVETVVLMLEGPVGEWRVVSYRIGSQ